MIDHNFILVADDNKAIHDDFRKILAPYQDKFRNELDKMEKNLFEKDNPPQNYLPVYAIDDAFQGEDAIRMVEQAKRAGRSYALIFMDVRMPPGLNGIEATKKIWEIDPDIEIVICTAYSDYSWNEIITVFGPTDRLLFLKKPFNSIEVKQMTLSLIKKWNLNAQLRTMITSLENKVRERTKQLQEALTQIKNANNELHEKNRILLEMTHQDGFTGLLNHAALYERIHKMIDELKQSNLAISLIMIDIDYLKKFNDNYGHQIGDEIIRQIATLLKENASILDMNTSGAGNPPEVVLETDSVTEISFVGRYGGDEFMLVVPYCEANKASAIAESLRRKISAIRLEGISELQITASFGIAVLNKGKACIECKELLNRADQALYNAKSKGRDRVEVSVYE